VYRGFDEMAKTDLIPTGHTDELDTEPASFGPTNLSQPYMEWRIRIWYQHPHLQVGAGLNSLAALDGTPGNGDVHDHSFSYAVFSGENNRKIRVHARAIPELDHF